MQGRYRRELQQQAEEFRREIREVLYLTSFGY